MLSWLWRRNKSFQNGDVIAYRAAVRDLYRRMKERGFDASFLREFVLPEWWSDELAEVEANRALAEGFIAKQLGFSLAELREPQRELSMPSIVEARFKRYKNQVDSRVKATALLAQQVAGRVIHLVKDDLPPFESIPADTLREKILRYRHYVDLDSLLDFCWSHGIPVTYLAHTPRAGKRFDGMAAFVDGHPVIVLGSKRDGPPWLAFHLAHELGHLMSGHVEQNQSLLDPTLATRQDGMSREEGEADEFACELLTGLAQPTIRNLKLNAPRLAATAEKRATALGIDPGVYALIYAKSNDRWAVAQEALKYMDLDSGGQDVVKSRLASRLPKDVDLAETDERLLRVLGAK